MDREIIRLIKENRANEIKLAIGEKAYNDFRCLKGKKILVRAELRTAANSKDENFKRFGA